VPSATVSRIDRSERAQLVFSVSHDAVARFRHLVPRSREVDERLGDDNPRLVRDLMQTRAIRVKLPQCAHIGAVVQRTRLSLARVPESPQALPISSSPLPQTEGEYDQGQANHHSEGTDERRQERRICTGQGCQKYAKEHRQGAASGQ
jgi:hypothetical protein